MRAGPRPPGPPPARPMLLARFRAAAVAVAKVVEDAAEVSNCEVRQRVYDAGIETLDGVLRIGRQAEPFDEAEVRHAIAVFEIARGDPTDLPDAA
jgi:hypothetical protein